jgi:hypothetical protein
MKKVLSALISSAFLLSVFFVGTASSKQPVTDENEPAISQDASKEKSFDILAKTDEDKKKKKKAKKKKKSKKARGEMKDKDKNKESDSGHEGEGKKEEPAEGHGKE